MSDEDISGQAAGFLFSLCVVVLFIVWSINTPPIIRYGVSAVIVLIPVCWIGYAMWGKTRIRRIRNQQIKNHGSGDKNKKPR